MPEDLSVSLHVIYPSASSELDPLRQHLDQGCEATLHIAGVVTELLICDEGLIPDYST